MADKTLSPDEISRNLRMVRHVKAWMKHKKITQSHLAGDLNVSEGLLSKYLRGTIPMTTATFSAIAALVGVPEELLLTDPADADALRPYLMTREVIERMPADRLGEWLRIGRMLADMPAEKISSD